MPKNASQNADGFRFYPWEGGDTPLNRKYSTPDKDGVLRGAVEKSDLLSVTSIKTLAGIAFQIVNWQINNVLNLAMGTRRVTRIGPKGGVKEVLVKDGPFPGEFVRRMMENDGANLDETRKWLRSTADHPRDVAAVRGSVVHKLIELDVPLNLVDEELVRRYMEMQWKEEKVKVKPDILEDDVNFVTNAMAQYWDMRAKVPFVVIAREPQIYNLTAGYGGSGDVILWFLGRFETRVKPTLDTSDGSTDPEIEVIFIPLPDADKIIVAMQKRANKKLLTLAEIEAVGGTLCVGDWKTSKGVYSSHVVQTIAYMAGEFIALDGIIDERMSDILAASSLGMVIHIRPNKWAVEVFEFRQDVLRAFLGSLAYARFLAINKTPDKLFIYSLSGVAEGTGDSEVIDDGGE